MSLVMPLPRTVSMRGILLPALVLGALLASASSLAPTVARAAGEAAHRAICSCPHCPGAAKCCCHGMGLR